MLHVPDLTIFFYSFSLYIQLGYFCNISFCLLLNNNNSVIIKSFYPKYSNECLKQIIIETFNYFPAMQTFIFGILLQQPSLFNDKKDGPFVVVFVCSQVKNNQCYCFNQYFIRIMSSSSVSKKSHTSHPSSSNGIVVSKKWNFLVITYNVSNKPPSQQVINQLLETTMKNTDLSFVVISLQVILSYTVCYKILFSRK